jgi:chorismate lyase / 3-hydroxybenzoate synthase
MRHVFASEREIGNIRAAHRGHIFRETRFDASFADLRADYPRAQIAIPSFDETAYEVWLAPDAVSCERTDIEVSASRDFVLIRILADEAGEGLAVPAYEAYRTLFTAMRARPLGHLVRIWNYIPGLLGETHGLERYRQFNIGRSLAWGDYGPNQPDGQPRCPAATGIGSHGGPIVIEALLTAEPVAYLQNPRQEPAHRYSPKYGPKAPVFSRATLCLGPCPRIYIAGTASLLGEDVAWVGDPQRQVEETFNNIAALIDDRNVSGHGVRPGFGLADLVGVRVYIKRESDYPVIRAAVEQVLGPAAQVLYLHDDICRPDFLVEIEGICAREP